MLITDIHTPTQQVCRQLLRRDGPNSNPGSDPEEQTESFMTLAPRILCANCKQEITAPEACIVMHGRHQHEFINPHGFQFLIACYKEANGCQISGECLSEDSWFPGYDWQYASCKQCKEHLGWHYQHNITLGLTDHFFGLICDRLIFSEQIN